MVTRPFNKGSHGERFACRALKVCVCVCVHKNHIHRYEQRISKYISSLPLIGLPWSGQRLTHNDDDDNDKW